MLLVVSFADPPVASPDGSLVVPSHSQPLAASTVPEVANAPWPSRLAELMLMLATGIIDSRPCGISPIRLAAGRSDAECSS